MSQGDVLRLLIVVVLASSVLGVVAMSWWEKRHPSRFEPVDSPAGESGAGSDEGSGRRAVERAVEINALHRP